MLEEIHPKCWRELPERETCLISEQHRQSSFKMRTTLTYSYPLNHEGNELFSKFDHINFSVRLILMGAYISPYLGGVKRAKTKGLRPEVRWGKGEGWLYRKIKGYLLEGKRSIRVVLRSFTPSNDRPLRDLQTLGTARASRKKSFSQCLGALEAEITWLRGVPLKADKLFFKWGCRHDPFELLFCLT